MITTHAIVVSYKDGIAHVQCTKQSSCSGCATQNSCGTVSLFSYTRSYNVKVSTLTPLKIGQQVLVGINEKNFLNSTIFAYLLPLLVLIGITLGSEWISTNELIRMAIIVLSLVITFFATGKILKKDPELVLLKVLS